jgi:acetone carboxylase gamma subunit
MIKVIRCKCGHIFRTNKKRKDLKCRKCGADLSKGEKK